MIFYQVDLSQVFEDKLLDQLLNKLQDWPNGTYQYLVYEYKNIDIYFPDEYMT